MYAKHMPSITAPYAANVIPLHLSSLTGLRHRTLRCMECGTDFLERNNDTAYRIGDPTRPTSIAISSSPIPAMCSHCSQQYEVHIAITVTLTREDVPLHQQPQSIYISSTLTKHHRLLHCLECGSAFQRISDRVTQVSDNHIDNTMLPPERLGAIGTLCVAKRCRQSWAFIL